MARLHSTAAIVAAVAIAVMCLATSFGGVGATLTVSVSRSQTVDGAWAYGAYPNNVVPSNKTADQLCTESEAGYFHCLAFNNDNAYSTHTGKCNQTANPRTYYDVGLQPAPNTARKVYKWVLSSDSKKITWTNELGETGTWTKAF